MNLNSRISERVSSPLREPTNQLNVEMKNNWNKLNGKDDETQNIDQADSPKIENLVEPLESSSSSAFKPFRPPTAFHAKRPKFETEECESTMEHEFQDDCEAFGKCVAAQLRQMSKMQKVLAQRLMFEICFRGQIQALQMNTGLNNHTSVFQQVQAMPLITARPAPGPTSHFNRGSDFMLVHQQNMRNQSHLTPGNASNSAVGASVSSQSFQNYANLTQPVEHMSMAAINHVVNLGQSET